MLPGRRYRQYAKAILSPPRADAFATYVAARQPLPRCGYD